MSSGRANLDLQGLGPEFLFYGDVASPTGVALPGFDLFEHRSNEITRPVPYVHEDFQVTPTTGTNTQVIASGSAPPHISFKFDRATVGDLMTGMMVLSFRLGVGAANTAPSGTECWVDGLAYAIDKVEHRFNQRGIWSITGDQIARWYETLPTEERDVCVMLSGGGHGGGAAGLPSRQNFAQQADNHVKIVLPHPYLRADKSCPIYGLNNSYEIAVYFKPNNQILWTNNVAVSDVYLDKFSLSWQGIHLRTAERDDIIQRLFNTQAGLTLKTCQHEVERHDVVSANATFTSDLTFALRNAVGPAYTARVIARYKNNIKPGAVAEQADLDPTNYLKIIESQVKNGQREVTARRYHYVKGSPNKTFANEHRPSVYTDDLQAYPRSKPDGALANTASFYWCAPQYVKDSEHDAHGSRTLQRYASSTLHLQMHAGTYAENTSAYDPTLWNNLPSTNGTGTQKNITIEYESLTHNILMFSMGDLRPTFSINNA